MHANTIQLWTKIHVCQYFVVECLSMLFEVICIQYFWLKQPDIMKHLTNVSQELGTVQLRFALLL